MIMCVLWQINNNYNIIIINEVASAEIRFMSTHALTSIEIMLGVVCTLLSPDTLILL